jgi:hypothetical protein
MINYKKVYRVSASVNPTCRTNAERIRVSSGRVSLYNYLTTIKFINFSEYSVDRKVTNR